ncbi:Cation transporting ATPase, C-terminus [Sphingobacterium multivorum]|uniref:Cation transporting ATPase, C-terminus n=5 Tax=Sphingobacteriaceae TaxID=84566 RepID=A0A2X2L3X4_SPHMU|nr:cation-translocating P-type ATPase C-terminal domain-containing protein [Sphingobacterium multivorum]SPZ83950.1 Cation transporting ATPase, C-terminus [Sphingobacterium multivorum]
MVFATLIFANILLSYANRSFHYSILESFKNRNLLLVGISIAVLLFLAVILYVAPVAQFFAVTALSGYELGIALSVAAVSVLWFEVYKLIRRISVQRKSDKS